MPQKYFVKTTLNLSQPQQNPTHFITLPPYLLPKIRDLPWPDPELDTLSDLGKFARNGAWVINSDTKASSVLLLIGLRSLLVPAKAPPTDSSLLSSKVATSKGRRWSWGLLRLRWRVLKVEAGMQVRRLALYVGKSLYGTESTEREHICHKCNVTFTAYTKILSTSQALL